MKTMGLIIKKVYDKNRNMSYRVDFLAGTLHVIGDISESELVDLIRLDHITVKDVAIFGEAIVDGQRIEVNDESFALTEVTE